MMEFIGDWWASNGAQFLIGATCMTVIGAVFALLFRAPIVRQRICEAVAAGVVLWLVLGLVIPPAETASIDVAAVRLAISDVSGSAAIDEASVGVAYFDWLGVLLAIGAVALSLYLLFASALLARLRWRARPAPGSIQDLAASLPLARASTRVLLSRDTSRPFCCGFLRPEIVLPEACGDESAESLRAVLMHEVAHLSQGDLRGRALFALALPVLFWNPLFWWLRNRAQLCAELVADDIAAQHVDKATYVRQLIQLARRSPQSRDRGAVRMAAIGKESEFYRRMKMLIHRSDPISNRCTTRQSLLRRLSALSLVALAACTWSPVAAPEPSKSDDDIVREIEVPAEDAPRVYFNFVDTPVVQVLSTIAKISGSNIVMSPSVKGNVTIKLKNVPWQNAMVIVAKQVDCVVKGGRNGIFRVVKRSE